MTSPFQSRLEREPRLLSMASKGETYLLAILGIALTSSATATSSMHQSSFENPAHHTHEIQHPSDPGGRLNRRLRNNLKIEACIRSGPLKMLMDVISQLGRFLSSKSRNFLSGTSSDIRKSKFLSGVQDMTSKFPNLVILSPGGPVAPNAQVLLVLEVQRSFEYAVLVEQ